MIPSARDHSEQATRLFGAAVPDELMTYLVKRAETLIPELRHVECSWCEAGRHVNAGLRRGCRG
jgi:hypothetical protein